MRALLPILFGIAAVAQASDLTVVFNPNPQSVVPGGTLQFTGTITNVSPGQQTIFINSDQVNFPITMAVDDSPFFNNAPISLDFGDNSGPFVFFNVTIPAVQTPGAYIGSFTVLGGTDDTTLNPEGIGTFEVDVDTPEPGALLLCGAAIAWLALRMRGRSPRRA